jgi:sugar/nucleoside kinase (ribokinase family)
MSAEVGCAGLLVEDTFCGPMAALPPEGALSVLVDMPVRAGGCAANVAIALAKQSVRVSVAGCVGQDSAANALIETFERHGIGTQGISREALPTSKTVILLIEGQDRRYLHVIGANHSFSVDHISRDWVASLGVFYLGGLFGLPGIELKQLAELLKFCRERKVLTVVDVVTPENVKGMAALKPLLPFIDVFVPNEDEARAFTGLTKAHDQVRMLEMAGANTVIITRGGEGTVAVQDGRIWSSGAFQMDVVDPSGSGDAFTSGVIRSLLEEWRLPQLLRYASAVGASATRAPGTTDSVFSASEAETFLAAHPLTVMEEHRWT